MPGPLVAFFCSWRHATHRSSQRRFSVVHRSLTFSLFGTATHTAQYKTGQHSHDKKQDQWKELQMNAKRLLGTTVALVAFAVSAAAIATPATHAKTGKFDVYADSLRVAKPDPFTDGNKLEKFDPFTDGAKLEKFDPFTDGTHSVAASALDNSRGGDGSLYGYRV
jgi:hypothetical protein